MKLNTNTNMKNLLFPAMIAILPLSLFAQKLPAGSQPVIQKVEAFEGGLINWTQGYIEVSGTSVFNPKFQIPAQRLEMAKLGARVVAKANLLEMVQGIYVYRETKVSDMMTESDEIKTKVEGTVKFAHQVASKTSDDGVTVTVRMPLGGTSGLAPILIDDVIQKSDNSGTSIPTPIDNSVRDRSDTKVDPATDSLPSFVLDFRGKDFDPRLFPVIVDEEGNIIFDYSKIYNKYKGDIAKYVDLSKKIAQDLNWKKGLDIIEAVQDPNGQIQIDTKKHPKLNNFLKKAWSVGKIAFPLVLGLL
jgi:hypothetical protein